MLNFVSFITSKVFFKHLVIISLVFVMLVALASIGLSIYTAHGDKISMPDLRGMTMEQVVEASSDYNFEFKIVDSMYIPEQKKGTVIDLTPKPGFSIKKNRVVFLTMNSVNPEFIKMPDLVNTSLRQAKSTMESYGLQLGRLHYKPDFAENYVLKQIYRGKNINPGSKIPKGSKIDLVLGLGEGEGKSVPVPDLIGMSYSSALAAISSGKLNLGARVFQLEIKTFSDSLDAVVWKQDPPASGQELQPGSIIDIWLKKENDNQNANQNEINEFEHE